MRLRNLTPGPVHGWFRTTTDTPPPASPIGSILGCDVIYGRKIGLDCWAVDVRAALGGNETLELPFEDWTTDGDWPTTAQVPTDIVGHFGGVPALNGKALDLVSLQPDGAGYRGHYRGRIGRMFHVDLFLGPWYPDHPAIVPAEVMLTCSNPEVPDMGDTLPELRLTFGNGYMLGSLPKPGMRFADGQARAIPVCFVWPRHLRTPEDWAYAGAIATKGVGAVGVSKLLPHGNPALPENYDLTGWARQHWLRCLSQLTTWEHPQLGPAADTGQAGGVEDQCFVGGECMLPNGVGAELVNYVAALLTSGHPMHHLEFDGTVVDPDRRPGVRYFYSRPHSSGIDRLGKPRDLTLAEASGWNGPDAQHWPINPLAVAARPRGSPACQRLLEHHAKNYVIQLTTNPQWSTSAIWSARELGWEGILAVHLWRCLDDRALAERVKVHFQERCRRILVPQLSGKTIWKTETGHPRISAQLGSPEPAWQLWMHAQGAYGLDLAGEILGVPAIRPIALETARFVMERGWRPEGGKWVAYAEQLVDGSKFHRDDDFDHNWMPLAPATVLRHESGNALARELWQQIVSEANGQGRWLPPETFLVR